VTPCVIAIDIGATKIAGALVEPGGHLIEQRVRPTRAAGPDGADRVWPELAGLVDELRELSGGPIAGVGVGSAGPLDLVHGTVSPVNIPTWRRFPVADKLTAHLGGLPVKLAGDGICAAIGEHWLGAARGVADVIVVVVSTGVGGGIIQGGRLYAGRTGNAGHIGHMVVDFDGDPCPCGGRGCVEAMSSGPRMVAWARRNGWRGRPSSPNGADPGRTTNLTLANRAVANRAGIDLTGADPDVAGPTVADPTGFGLTAVDLADSARAGDEIALAAFERAARALAAGIASTAASHDLTHAVIGGGVSRAADLLLPPLRRAISEYAKLDFVRDLRVDVAALGSAAGLHGAAALVLDESRYRATVA